MNRDEKYKNYFYRKTTNIMLSGVSRVVNRVFYIDVSTIVDDCCSRWSGREGS